MNFGLFTLFDYYPEDQSAKDYYRFVLDEVAYAEELGFDSVWLGEHHFCNYLCPSPQIFAASVAERTERMRIGTAVTIAPLHDPVRLAEDYAMVDVLSNGRLDFGAGRGFQADSYNAFNRSMDESRELLMEGIEIIDKAWTEETLTYEGRYRQVRDLPVLPRPVQQPRPPIWVGTSLSPESYQFAGSHGYHLKVAAIFSPLRNFLPLIELYRESLEKAGYDPMQAQISTGNHCYVGTSTAQATAVWEHYYRRYLRFFSSLLDSKTYEKSEQHQSFTRLPTLLDNLSFTQARATLAVCGDAEECIDRITQAQEMVGNTHYWIYADLGGLPREEVWASLRRFAEKVMPKFR